MDRIEISRSGNEAEITIRFSTRIQYLRHGPAKPGKLLRVFVRLIDPAVPESDVMQQTMSAPKTDLVPRFTITYPELTNGMLVTFSQETNWDVVPGTDGRSIVIRIPALAGAKDVAAGTRTIADPGRQPAPAAEAPASPAPVPAEPAEAAVVAVPTTPAPVPPAAATAPAVVTTGPGPQEPVTPAPSTPVEAAPVLTAEQVESMARTFLDDARKAVAANDLTRAINRLNRTLSLPTNSQTEPAQALIGEIRELAGEIAKARAEYELYVKVFPSGPSVARVKERLARLPKIEPRSKSLGKALPAQPGPAEWTFYGSVSQYLYRGNSHIEVTTPPPPGALTFTTDVLSMTDQNALISTIDLNARRRDGITDTRIVVRDNNTQNYLARQKSNNRLYSAYVEQTDRRLGYMVRFGRQNPTGGGVLERFDGVAAGYTFSDRWRVNGVAGMPVEFMSPYKKSFYGVSVDMLAQPEQVGISTYFIQQYLEGAVNRQAVGVETRYFDSHAAVFGMLDYDIAFRGLNILMAQGNYRTDAGTNYFTYIDHRKTPPLGLTNAVSGMPGQSIKDALDSIGLAQLRVEAAALTATSDMLAVGFTHPYTPRWMFGADYRAAKISGTEASGSMPAMAGSGLNHVFSVQAIGNALWTDNDVAVVNGSYVKGTTYDGQAIGLNYVFLHRDTWRLDGNLRYYTQRDDDGTRQKRWSPSLKVGYRWKQATLEGEYGVEDVRVDGPSRIERSRRKYFFVGYRWDFR